MLRFIKNLPERVKRHWYFMGGGDPACLREMWEKEWSEGRWDYLAHESEAARYGVMAGLARSFAPQGRVLDVGCGEGLLLDLLPPSSLSGYVGVDLALAALVRARSRHGGDQVAFVNADASCFAARGQFDLIIFNEVLYCFPQPLGVLEHYRPHLAPGGLFLVSMYHSLRNRLLFKSINRIYLRKESVKITNLAGITWQMEVLAPPE